MMNGKCSGTVKKISVLAVLLLCICFVAGNAALSFADSYKYEVTMSGGDLGTVEGATKIMMSYDDQWNANDHKVTVKNKKYYFKGFAKSGHEELVGSFKVTEDTDLVAVYGIKGKMVAYEVSYQEKDTGKTLAESRTLYGNKGDKPVAAYVHVDGYMPQAYNITKTLSGDASKNKFTFYYTELTADEEGGSGTGDNGNGNTDEEGNGGNGNGDNESGNGNGTDGDGNGTGNGDGGNDGAANGNGADGNANANNGQTIADSDTPATAPADTLDLDEEEVPLADDDQSADDSKSGGGAMKWIIIGAVIAIAAIIAALVARSRRREE